MALPEITSRPEKEIETFDSKWNASDLPIQYAITNYKYPTNTDGAAEVVNSIDDNNGYAQLTLDAATSLVAKDWVSIDAGGYQGVYQIRSVESTTEITINEPYTSDESGTITKHYNNYNTSVNIYVGIDGDHPLEEDYELIGTIGQVPTEDNQTLIDVRNYVKSKLINQLPTEGNDTTSWKDFYIEFAESYDEVTDGVISTFTSAYTSDSANFAHATYSSLQFGNQYGGNMYNYVVDPNKLELASWMTDFDRLFILEYNETTISIIINDAVDLVARYMSYDKNDVLQYSNDLDIDFNGYGIYRIPLIYGFADDRETAYLTVQLFDSDIAVSNSLTFDIDNTCLSLYNIIDSDGACIVDSDDSPIIST